MSYNWEEILSNKCTKDLYKIYMGQAGLPKETILLAKEELDSRNFDFNNIEYYKKSWRLSRLIQLQDTYNSEAFTNKLFYVSIWIYLIILSIITILFLVLIPIKEELTLYIWALGLTSFIILINNLFYHKEQKTVKKRLKSIFDLKQELEIYSIDNSKNNAVVNDIQSQRRDNMDKNKNYSYVLIIIMLLIFLARIFIN